MDARLAERPIAPDHAVPRSPTARAGDRFRDRRSRATSRPSAPPQAQRLRGGRRRTSTTCAQGQAADRPRQLFERRARAADGLLADHGADAASRSPTSWQEALGHRGRRRTVALPSCRSTTASASADVAVLTEQDMLGDRLVRRRAAPRSADAFLAELAR